MASARSPVGGQRSPQGFTLIEVLVAIAILALMALMSWRGIDAMLRTQRALQQRADQASTLQAGLAQWQADLARIANPNGTSSTSGISSWDWDGRVLRLTREDVQPTQGLRVVAWSWRQDAAREGGGDWMRWQSPPLQTRAAWQQAWDNARLWSQTPTAELRSAEVSVHPLSGWQLFVHRGGSWTNPLSSDATTASAQASSASSTPAATGAVGATSAASTASTAPRLPDGVRLLLELPATAAAPGRIVLDWVRPTLSGAAP